MDNILAPITEEQLQAFLASLSTQDINKFTEEDYAAIYKFIDSDGCTCVPDIYVDACTEHDFYFRTHRDFYGQPITLAEANARFRRRIQAKSPFGVFSCVSWWRWLGVSIFGPMLWKEQLPTTVFSDKVIENKVKLPWQKD